MSERRHECGAFWINASGSVCYVADGKVRLLETVGHDYAAHLASVADAALAERDEARGLLAHRVEADRLSEANAEIARLQAQLRKIPKEFFP